MPPRYGSAQGSGSCGTAYVDNGTAGKARPGSAQHQPAVGASCGRRLTRQVP